MLPVFSSVSLLVAALGRSQPWAVLPLAQVIEAAAGGPGEPGRARSGGER